MIATFSFLGLVPPLATLATVVHAHRVDLRARRAYATHLRRCCA